MPTDTLLQGVPEIFETNLDESLKARNEALALGFKEIGPVDLVHIIKTSPKQQPHRDIGSYHYAVGVDCSSSASIAAYLNSLTYNMLEGSGWFTKNPWKITRGIYCCYNAFSNVDMRVEARIPGGVKSYCVYSQGQRSAATTELWIETSVSAVLRAFYEPHDPSLIGLRRIDPLASDLIQKRFLESAKVLFFKAKNLGCSADIQVPTVIFNYLTQGIVSYFKETGRPDIAAAFFEDLIEKEPLVASLVADCLFEAREQHKGMHFLFEAFQNTPFTKSFPLLYSQCRFLLGKKDYKKALPLAKLAVETAATEFNSWALLCEVYLSLGQYENALITLNSCPMFSVVEKDKVKMPPPLKLHISIKNGDDKWPDMVSEEYVDVTLQQLQAPFLKGTFKRAYYLLTRICLQLGWDKLLHIRSNVFVMEEEYQVLHEDVRWNTTIVSADCPPKNPLSGTVAATVICRDKTNSVIPSLQAYPKSREKGTSATMATEVTAEASADSVEKLAKSIEAIESTKENGNIVLNANKEPDEMLIRDFREAAQSAAENKMTSLPRAPNTHPAQNHVPSKRLCERWLDHLFILLYEDLRVAMMWRAEVQHLAQQHMGYRRSPAEWEILGTLAVRLGYPEEAKSAFQQAIEIRHTVLSLTALLKIYTDEGKLLHALTIAANLISLIDARHESHLMPSPLSQCLFQLIREHGWHQIQAVIATMNLSSQVQPLVQRVLDVIASVRPLGCP